MNKLFTDAETMQKERPNKITEEQKKQVLTEIAQDIKSWNLTSADLDTIIKDLDNLTFNDSSFEMAKDLDCFSSDGSYEINSSLMECLENIQPLLDDKKRENIKLWVKAHDIKPKLFKGQKVTLKKAPSFSFIIGDEVYINGIREAEAEYVVDLNPERKGGVCINYERLENCI